MSGDKSAVRRSSAGGMVDIVANRLRHAVVATTPYKAKIYTPPTSRRSRNKGETLIRRYSPYGSQDGYALGGSRVSSSTAG